jgi:raffinose/stachyose/melibiose transport system permease protein
MGCVMNATISMKKNKASPLIHLFLILLGVFQLFPLIVLFLNTLRTDSEIKNMPIGIPKTFYYQNYIETWIKGEYGTAFINSLFIAAVTILIVLACTGLAAYSIVKLDLLWKKYFIAYFMLVMSLPGFLYIVPDFYLFNKLGLVNSHAGIILIYAASQIPFNLLLIRTFLIGIPKELEEAGRVDGCGELGVLWHITIPLAKPILTTVALLVFVHCWNEFLWANTFLQDDAVRTVATRYVKFTSEWTRDLAKIFTAGGISLLPIIIMYLFLQRTFIEGMTKGGVKG